MIVHPTSVFIIPCWVHYCGLLADLFVPGPSPFKSVVLSAAKETLLNF